MFYGLPRCSSAAQNCRFYCYPFWVVRWIGVQAFANAASDWSLSLHSCLPIQRFPVDAGSVLSRAAIAGVATQFSRQRPRRGRAADGMPSLALICADGTGGSSVGRRTSCACRGRRLGRSGRRRLDRCDSPANHHVRPTGLSRLPGSGAAKPVKADGRSANPLGFGCAEACGLTRPAWRLRGPGWWRGLV